MSCFTKKDLEDGDVVLRRDGTVEIYIEKFGCFIGNDTYSTTMCLNDDLTDISDKNEDIIKVKRPKHFSECRFHIFDNNTLGTVVYDRDNPNSIEMPVIEMTFAEIENALGHRVKVVKSHT